MALPDATAGAQLSSSFFCPAYVGWLDIDTDPVRVTSAKSSLTFSGTGDADLDGFTYSAVDPTMINLSPVLNREGGAQTVTASLSGIVGPDSALLDVMGDRTKWQGRAARFWAVIYDETGAQQGAVWNFYTGRMSAMRISGAPDNQTVEIDIETYLAALTGASGRTYIDQPQFDPLDQTAQLKLGAANGATKGVAGLNAYRIRPPSYWVPGMPYF